MTRFLKPITNLLLGDPGAEARKAAEKQSQLTQIAQQNQKAALQAEDEELAPKRPPRGRRLLIAPESGAQGLSNTLGG